VPEVPDGDPESDGDRGGQQPGAIVLLTRLARSAYRHVDEELLGVRLKEFTALSSLRDTGGRAQKELGDAPYGRQ
jgi:hypothetical protein